MNNALIDDTRRGGWLRVVRRHWPLGLGIVLGAFELFDQEPWEPKSYITMLLPAVALAYLVIGAVRGELQRPVVLAGQTVGLLGFGLLAVVALVVEPAVGRYVVAAGWFGHAVWDLVHHRKNIVVPRGVAEFCVVFDLLLAASLIAPTL